METLKIIIKGKCFPTGLEIYPDRIFYEGSHLEGSINLYTEPTILLSPNNERGYEFSFWNVQGDGGGISKSMPYELSINIEDTYVIATAWYNYYDQTIIVPTKRQVITYALSNSKSEILDDTPIESIIPPLARINSTTVSTLKGDVSILACNSVRSAPKETFAKWELLVDVGMATSNGNVINAEHLSSIRAIAYYASNIQKQDSSKPGHTRDWPDWLDRDRPFWMDILNKIKDKIENIRTRTDPIKGPPRPH